MSRLPERARRHASILAVLAAAVSFQPEAQALEEQRGEEAAIKACDKRLCSILMQKNAKGEDLKCHLTKTWTRSTIKEADSQKLSWNFGDARCTADINLSRVTLVSALMEERRKLRVPPHTVDCVVEQDGKPEKVKATLAPKIEFIDGKADKVWINLKEIEGPAGIKATLQTAAQLVDTFGLFHRRLIKSVNRYIERHCPKTFHHLVATSPRPPESPKPNKK